MTGESETAQPRLRCELCGGPVRRDNTLGICRKTAACRRARFKVWQAANGRDGPKVKPNCKVPECPKPHYAHGYCGMHWKRVQRTGDPGPAELSNKPIIITAGEVFGRWVTLENYRPGHQRIRCCCECGTEKEISAYSLRRGTSRSCGCGRRKDGSQSPKRKLRRNGAPYVATGTVLWHLTALEDAMLSVADIPWRCKCGAVVRKNARQVKHGKTKSCGCVRRAQRTTHGLSSHPLYAIWHGIIQRTTMPATASYPHYGGRGITICERWLDVTAFIADIERLIGPRPAGHSLDRRRNGGNYEPGNVRWAPPKVQTANRRTVAKLECENAELRARIAELESCLS